MSTKEKEKIVYVESVNSSICLTRRNIMDIIIAISLAVIIIYVVVQWQKMKSFEIVPESLSRVPEVSRQNIGQNIGQNVEEMVGGSAKMFMRQIRKWLS